MCKSQLELALEDIDSAIAALTQRLNYLQAKKDIYEEMNRLKKLNRVSFDDMKETLRIHNEQIEANIAKNEADIAKYKAN